MTKTYIFAGSDSNGAMSGFVGEMRARGEDVVIISPQPGQTIEQAIAAANMEVPSNVVLATHGSENGRFGWREGEGIQYGQFFAALPNGVQTISVGSCYGGMATNDLQYVPPGAVLQTFVGTQSVNFRGALDQFARESSGNISNYTPTDYILEALDNVDPAVFAQFGRNQNYNIDPRTVLPHVVGIGGVPPVQIDISAEMTAFGASDARFDRSAIARVQARFDTVGTNNTVSGNRRDERELDEKIADVARRIERGETLTDIQDIRIGYALMAAQMDVKDANGVSELDRRVAAAREGNEPRPAYVAPAPTVSRDVQPRLLNADEVAQLPVLDADLNIIAQAYVERDGDITGLDTMAQTQAFVANLTNQFGGRSRANIIMEALPDDAARDKFIQNLQVLATSQGVPLSNEVQQQLLQARDAAPDRQPTPAVVTPSPAIDPAPTEPAPTVEPTQSAPVAAASAPSTPSGWGYGIATDYKNGAEGGAADQQIGNDAFEITSIAALLQERFGITVQGNPPTLAQLNTALQSPEMRARLAEYNQGKPADQQITPADLDLTRIAALTGEARDAANDKFANGIAALANSGIARDGLAAREADGVPLAAVDSDTVRAMQEFMNAQGFKDADGNSLVVDGIVGPKTTAAFAALEAAAGVNPATGNISPALLDFVRERQDLALGREEERAMAIAAENGTLTRDEVARMNAIDDAIDILAERGVDVTAMRAEFAQVREAMRGQGNEDTVTTELGQLVAAAGPNAAAIREAAGMAR